MMMIIDDEAMLRRPLSVAVKTFHSIATHEAAQHQYIYLVVQKVSHHRETLINIDILCRIKPAN